MSVPADNPLYPGSVKLDYEAELALVIGSRAHRVQEADGLRTSSLGQRILAGIENLRGRWFGNK